MERFEQTVEIAVPLRTAYNQWTQFEKFPHFMHDVLDVAQTDDTHMHRLVSVAGQRLEWDTEIMEQVPDELIEWRSCSGAPHACEARFDALDDEREIEKSLEQFKQFIEKRGVETGGWRGEVHDETLPDGDPVGGVPDPSRDR